MDQSIHMEYLQSFGVIFAMSFLAGGLWYLWTKGIIYRHLSVVGGRVIRDHDLVWRHAITPALSWFIAAVCLAAFIAHNISKYKVDLPSIVIVLIAALTGGMMMHFVNCWRSYNFGVLIDGTRNILDVPASDQAQTLSETLLLKPFFDHARRETLRLSELEAIDNASTSEQNQRVFWLTISGQFGSRALEFSDKQKRDECRNAIIAEYKKARSSSVRADINWDF